ncbi:MAG: diguanylate cyclase [Nitrosomonadales bacterium]|nr:diguanylate cyclase [Nitrosomonadales bacterium]
MKHYDITREKLQGILAKLEHALIHHQHWHAGVIRSISCKLLVDKCDLAPESFRTCGFGQWYYSNENEDLREFAGFVALGEKHKLMHQMAEKLLIEAQEEGPVDVFDFDNFANALEGMRLELSALEHELENMLYNHDALTGAITRYGILPAFREQHELIKRGLQSSCIVMVDLDNFKTVNDRYGHLAGDRALIASARYMIEHLRSYDKVFRYGGEEFLLLLQHTEMTAGYELVERLRKGIESLTIDVEGQVPIHITASFGLVCLDPDSPVESSIDRADKAMYMAKAAGRNSVRIGDLAPLSEMQSQ